MRSFGMRTRVFVVFGAILSIVLTTLAFSLIAPELFAENYSPVNIHKGIGVSILAAASIRMTVFLFKKNGAAKVSIIPNEGNTEGKVAIEGFDHSSDHQLHTPRPPVTPF